MYKPLSNEANRRRSLQGALSSSGHLPAHVDQQMVTITAENIPLPTKCSSQLRKLLQEHSLNVIPPRILDSTLDQLKQLPQSQKDCSDDGSDGVAREAVSRTSGGSENVTVLTRASTIPAHSNNDTRPIYPHLPYSPYGSPATSPRVRRKPLRETTRVNSINDQSGEFVQLNQYKVEGAIGQVSTFCSDRG